MAHGPPWRAVGEHILRTMRARSRPPIRRTSANTWLQQSEKHGAKWANDSLAPRCRQDAPGQITTCRERIPVGRRTGLDPRSL